ncbi:MAG: hypothetical protein KTR28_01025 [Micavibrio sp.]|nr:hypothetical protein [Micavibrio sp.]
MTDKTETTLPEYENEVKADPAQYTLAQERTQNDGILPPVDAARKIYQEKNNRPLADAGNSGGPESGTEKKAPLPPGM